MKTGKNLRKVRVRSKIRKNSNRLRLSVFRSNKFLYAQIIDDLKGKTLLGISEKSIKTNELAKKQERSKELGLVFAKKALDKKIKKVVFDRGPYKYHGRIKAFAQGAREGGLEF
jgi:large subunit ribosomal protein L18